jgi:hypothetical protein
MRGNERESLRQRFRFRCGYCGVAEADVGAQLTLDHFQPRSWGGGDGPDNWVYSCHPCNEFKGDYWHEDPSRRLLHPLRDDYAANMSEDSEGVLCPLTARGAAHIERLHLNRPQLVAFRRQRRQAAETREAQTRLLENLRRLEKQVQALSEQLARLRSE